MLIGISTGTTGQFLDQLTGLLALWVGAYLVIKGDLTIGQLIAFRNFRQCSWPIDQSL